MHTKRTFTDALENELRSRYEWACDPLKLKKFMDAVWETINGGRNTWNFTGEACSAAWSKIGGKGKPTLKALRELPSGF